MGKKSAQNRAAIPDIKTFQISKSKTFNTNLNSFIKMLEEHYKNLTSRQFIKEVHQYIARFREKTKGRELALGQAKQKIKICRQCDGWCGNKHMVQCTLCEDYYHEQCLAQSKDSFESNGLCLNCEKNRIGKFDKQAYLHQLLQDRCSKCEGERKDKEAFVQCLRCSNRFHKKCYGKSSAVCANCKSQIDGTVTIYSEQLKTHVRQSTLHFFVSSTKKKVEEPAPVCQQATQQTQPKCFKYSKDEEETKTQPIKDQFCFNFEPMNDDDIKHYKEGLMFAILAKNMQYTEKLIPIQCSLEIDTQDSLDFGLDHMSFKEYQIYRNYKKQPVGPLNFVYKQGMGYDVVADRDIKQKTLICEYIGEVVTLRKCVELQCLGKNDSIMELRSGFNSDQTLIIRPEKYTNMARFINGINNSKASSKANVGTVRKLARGIPTVILYTIKNIRKGESLLYDYNAGSTNCQYDTSNFL